MSASTVLAIDPGSSKCGLAVVKRAGSTQKSPEVLHRGVVPSSDLDRKIAELTGRFAVDVILIGDGTSSSRAAAIVRQVCTSPIELVDERETSLAARKMYFQENPPRGLRRLIPVSLQIPPCPYDDCVALILAQRYFSKG